MYKLILISFLFLTSTVYYSSNNETIATNNEISISFSKDDNTGTEKDKKRRLLSWNDDTGTEKDK